MLCMGFYQIRLDRLRARLQDDLAYSCVTFEKVHWGGLNIFCIYRLVQTSEWAEECGKIWVLFIPEYVRNKWNLVNYSNLQYIVCIKPPPLRAGRETFTKPNFPLRTPGPQISITQVWNVLWFVKNKNGGHKITVMIPEHPPRVGYQNVGNFKNCGQVGSKQKNTLDRKRYVRDELQKSPWNGN